MRPWLNLRAILLCYRWAMCIRRDCPSLSRLRDRLGTLESRVRGRGGGDGSRKWHEKFRCYGSLNLKRTAFVDIITASLAIRNQLLYPDD